MQTVKHIDLISDIETNQAFSEKANADLAVFKSENSYNVIDGTCPANVKVSKTNAVEYWKTDNLTADDFTLKIYSYDPGTSFVSNEFAYEEVQSSTADSNINNAIFNNLSALQRSSKNVIRTLDVLQTYSVLLWFYNKKMLKVVKSYDKDETYQSDDQIVFDKYAYDGTSKLSDTMQFLDNSDRNHAYDNYQPNTILSAFENLISAFAWPNVRKIGYQYDLTYTKYVPPKDPEPKVITIISDKTQTLSAGKWYFSMIGPGGDSNMYSYDSPGVSLVDGLNVHRSYYAFGSGMPGGYVYGTIEVDEGSTIDLCCAFTSVETSLKGTYKGKSCTIKCYKGEKFPYLQRQFINGSAFILREWTILEWGYLHTYSYYYQRDIDTSDLDILECGNTLVKNEIESLNYTIKTARTQNYAHSNDSVDARDGSFSSYFHWKETSTKTVDFNQISDKKNTDPLFEHIRKYGNGNSPGRVEVNKDYRKKASLKVISYDQGENHQICGCIIFKKAE